MKNLHALGAAALTVAVTASGSVSARSRPPVPHIALATIPSIGTVFGRYEACGTDGARFSLGIRVRADATSTTARFRAGGFTRERKLWDPPYATRWFQFSRQRVQWLTADAGGEGGHWGGVVRVDFGRWDCSRYTSPRVTVQTYPRSPWGRAFPYGSPGR